MGNELCVEIWYRLSNESKWRTIILAPQEYFDLDEGEEIEVDCVPKNNCTLDYIPIVDKEKVEDIKAVITNKNKNVKRTFLEKYWNNQQNFIVERIDERESNVESEIIIETVFSEKEPKKTEVIRLVRREGILTPVLHSFITDNKDGSQSEIQVI